MTANELAEIQAFKTEELTMWERNHTATMLRQQQALINQREDEIKAFYNLVAEQDKKIIDLAFEKVYAERSAEVVAELYTHPVKELTNEEILRVHSQMMEDSKGQLPPYVDFARAILRKAKR